MVPMVHFCKIFKAVIIILVMTISFKYESYIHEKKLKSVALLEIIQIATKPRLLLKVIV